MNVRQVIPRDAIPSVDDPSFATTYDGDPDDEVIVVDADVARAYPVRFLHYHEIVNDVAPIAGETIPIAVTWCPLCASAVVYDRRIDAADGDPTRSDDGPALADVDDAPTLTFGVSGKLADDDLVMYDGETDSEWKQSLGEAIAGPLEGTRLAVLPATMTTWERFRERHPDGVVLEPPGGESEAAGDGDEPAPIEYDDDPYHRYFERDGFGLAAHRGDASREWDRDDLDPKAIVLGLAFDEEARGVPLPVVESAGGVVQLSVGDRDAAVFATPDGIHAFDPDGVSFAPTDDPGTFAGDGTRWDGATGESVDGRALDRLPARRLFAFAWQDDHGPACFYGLE